MKSKTGFTLIELVITIAIIAIMAVLAIPSYNALIQRNRLDAAARMLQSDLMYARGEAIKRNSSGGVSICPTKSQTACDSSAWTDARRISALATALSPPQVFRISEPFSPTIAMTVAPAAPATIAFTGSGMLAPNTAAPTFTLCNANGATVAGTGRIVTITVPGKVTVTPVVGAACP